MDIISRQLSWLSQCVYHRKPSCDVSSSHVYLPTYVQACGVYENGAKSITSGHAQTYIVASCSERALRSVAEECDYTFLLLLYTHIRVHIYIYAQYIYTLINILACTRTRVHTYSTPYCTAGRRRRINIYNTRPLHIRRRRNELRFDMTSVRLIGI